MTNFHGFRLRHFRLRHLGSIGMGIIATGAIASLTACVTVQAPPVATSPSPASPTPTKAASPSPSVAAVPPVATPVTVSVESAAPAPSPAAPAAPPAKTNTTPRSTGICKANEGAIISVETKNYRVAICGKGEPEFYVGVEKDDPTSSIRLPLTSFSQGFYEAKNGNTIYILAKTNKGHFLTVTQGEKELLREVVSGWGD